MDSTPRPNHAPHGPHQPGASPAGRSSGERGDGLDTSVGDGLPRTTRLATYAVIRDAEDRRLLCRIAPGYPAAGKWTLPGGGLEFGEDPADGVLRELTEETGFVGRIIGDVKVHSEMGVWRRPDGPVRFHHVRFLYPVEIVGGAEAIEVGGSTDAFGWFRPEDLDALDRIGIVDVAHPR